MRSELVDEEQRDRDLAALVALRGAPDHALSPQVDGRVRGAAGRNIVRSAGGLSGEGGQGLGSRVGGHADDEDGEGSGKACGVGPGGGPDTEQTSDLGGDGGGDDDA